MAKTDKRNKTVENVTFPQAAQMERYAPYIVAGLTFIGLLLRLYRVDYLSLWVDEYVHVWRAIDFLQGGSLITNDNNGIFLTFLVSVSYFIFGISDFASRLPSVILGGLVVPALYYLGKRLFNVYVGLFASVLATFSLYSVYWSRLSRNYASFELSYILLLVVFLLAFEADKKNKPDTPGFFEKQALDVKYFILLPFAFIFSLLNHQLTFFFFFSVGAYASTVALKRIIKQESNRFNNKYAVILYPTLLAGLLFFTPILGDIFRPLLRLFLPDFAVTWVLPNWGYILSKWASPEKYKIFSMYFGVLRSDYTLLYILGISGFILAFLLNKKSAVFLAAFFIMPLLLMSFIFRDPSLPRYLIFLYPLFLISIAAALFWIIQSLLPKVVPANVLAHPYAQHGITPLAIALLIVLSPFSEVWALIRTDQHGQVIKKELSVWHFTNWKASCLTVKNQIQPDDIVISTMPNAANHYLERDNSLWFRQRHFDTDLRKYVSNEPGDAPGNSAWTYEEFVATVDSNQRGWLIVDYYFYNVMTDPRARDYAIRNMKYIFDASKDGTVQVFAWEHDSPEPEKRFILEVGKGGRTLSQPLSVTLPSLEPKGKIMIAIDAEGIDSDNEAFIIINTQSRVFLPKCRSTQRETIALDLDTQWLKPGRNTIQFGYNENNRRDTRRGYAIYNLRLNVE